MHDGGFMGGLVASVGAYKTIYHPLLTSGRPPSSFQFPFRYPSFDEHCEQLIVVGPPLSLLRLGDALSQLSHLQTKRSRLVLSTEHLVWQHPIYRIRAQCLTYALQT